MIAHVVFDLPVEGPFDYLIPEGMQGCISEGMRVMVPFAGRQVCGFVVRTTPTSDIKNLKAIASRCEDQPIFAPWMLALASAMTRRYGCALGQALALMLPQVLRKGRFCSTRFEEGRRFETRFKLFHSKRGDFSAVIAKCIQSSKGSVLILVPDAFYYPAITALIKSHLKNRTLIVDDVKSLKDEGSLWLKVRSTEKCVFLGKRSSVFAPISDLSACVMIDEDNSSYREEQSPSYETRDVLMMRAHIQNFEVDFCSITPTPELVALVEGGHVQKVGAEEKPLVRPQAVDLTNYKFVPGLVSIPLKNAIDKALLNKNKSILVLNRRGAYSLTRCVECGFTLKCQKCDSPMMYSRTEEAFLCKHCSFKLPSDTDCPQCRKPSWKSIGMGVEQLQKELQKYFPTAHIASFEKDTQALGKFDILITTQAVLRFKDTLSADALGIIDFDSELNRMDIKSAFRAWSLVNHLLPMAKVSCFIQTRNPNHYVIESLIRQDFENYYKEELRLRQEFGFSPYKHWIKIIARSKVEKNAKETIEQIYQNLSAHPMISVTPMHLEPKRYNQFRSSISVHTNAPYDAMDLIKQSLVAKSRKAIVSVTLD